MQLKKLVVLVLGIGLLLFTASAGAVDRDAQEKRKRLEVAKSKLDNLEWKIKVNPMSGIKAKAYEDTLIFANPRVLSKKLESEGFFASNYTVSFKGEDVIVWETMQTSEDGGFAFWHGELKNDVIKGVLSMHPDKKRHIDFSFYSIEKKEFLPKMSKAEEIKEGLVPEIVESEPTAKDK